MDGKRLLQGLEKIIECLNFSDLWEKPADLRHLPFLHRLTRNLATRQDYFDTTLQAHRNALEIEHKIIYKSVMRPHFLGKQWPWGLSFGC